VLGGDPFGAALADIEGKQASERTLIVHRDADPGSLQNCHVVFVTRSYLGEIPEILARLGELPVVTVSEGEEFVEQGGTIGLVLSEGKVRFEINVDTAKRHGIRISSKLLRLASRLYSGRLP
jgi:hypothetical protein